MPNHSDIPPTIEWHRIPRNEQQGIARALLSHVQETLEQQPVINLNNAHETERLLKGNQSFIKLIQEIMPEVHHVVIRKTAQHIQKLREQDDLESSPVQRDLEAELLVELAVNEIRDALQEMAKNTVKTGKFLLPDQYSSEIEEHHSYAMHTFNQLNAHLLKQMQKYLRENTNSHNPVGTFAWLKDFQQADNLPPFSFTFRPDKEWVTIAGEKLTDLFFLIKALQNEIQFYKDVGDENTTDNNE